MIYLTLFLEFFKIGLFCFGGAFGMLPLIQETVLNHRWLTEAQFFDLVGLCESTPGPIAVNMATYIGSTQGGILGSIVATLGVITPSFIIIVLIASVLKNFTENKYFKGFIKGVQPVVTGLIFATGLTLLIKALGYVSLSEFNFNAISAVILVLLTAIYFIFKKLTKKRMSAVKFIIVSAFLGIVVNIIAEIF